MLAGFDLGPSQSRDFTLRAPRPIYYISEIEITNIDGYTKEYAPKVQGTVKSRRWSPARRWTKDNRDRGGAPKSRAVVQVWDSLEKIQACAQLAEYKEKTARSATSTRNSVLRVEACRNSRRSVAGRMRG